MRNSDAFMMGRGADAVGEASGERHHKQSREAVNGESERGAWGRDASGGGDVQDQEGQHHGSGAIDQRGAAEDPHFARKIFQAAPGVHGNVTPEILIEAKLDGKCRGRRGGTGLSCAVLARGFLLFKGVVGRANQRPGLDVFDAHGFAEALEFGELVGMNVALDGQVFGRGLHVLAESEDVRALRGDILHGGENFVAGFAESQHHAGFCGQPGDKFSGAAEQFERTLVHGTLADLAIQARNGFHVVIQDVGLGGHYRFESVPIAAKIGNQDFDFASGDARANFRDGAREDGGATVGLIVAIHGSDDSVTQAHSCDSFSDALRLVFGGRAERFAAGYCAESAGSRADISQNHEGCGAMLPTFAHVGAARAFADGVEIERAHGALQFLIFRSAKEANAQPGRAWVRHGRRSGIGKNGEWGRHVNDFDYVLYAEEQQRDNRGRQRREVWR